MDPFAQTELERKLFDLSNLLNQPTKPRRRPKPRVYTQNVEVTKVMNEGDRGTCAAVAFSHAFGITYNEALEVVTKHTNLDPKKGKGTSVEQYDRLLTLHGWKWHAAKGHLGKADLSQLPPRCIIRTARHVVACIEGKLYDQFETHRAAGCKNIKGYWAPI